MRIASYLENGFNIRSAWRTLPLPLYRKRSTMAVGTDFFPFPSSHLNLCLVSVVWIGACADNHSQTMWYILRSWLQSSCLLISVALLSIHTETSG
ncbi:hypothetical protein BDN71DRAFT_1029304 [Pleurotus eryngii]|uniref:Uncharacterized protein n=1 Tax=Pleurotus eryngii TaxID=5323 RepID=A0A9P6AB00_PLEER|nr:hypothetical protein BDN71DRAFT_1029304 [Pleurotus eryngii]